MSVRIFRWRAVGPLLGFAIVAGVLWLLFGDRVARRAAEKMGTAIVGAKVEIQRLHIDLARGDVTVRGLTVASPHEALKNLVQADELTADLDVVPLLEKKIVIDRLAATGLRFGTPRETDGRVPGDPSASVAGRAMTEAKAWSQQFQVPALQLATGKIDVGTLDPRNLSAIPGAEALAARTDSSRRAWQRGLDSLRLAPTLDSARATLQRLRGARATDLAAVNEARRAIYQLKRARGRVTTLERSVTGGLASLRAGAAGLDSLKQRDYATAKGLLKLPSLDAPEIGAALFAPTAVARFERALYWTQLARQYMPPGLQPRPEAGPPRRRRAGATVRFPREHALPGFLLRTAELSFLLDPTAAGPKRYAGRLTGLTSDPALYGRPTLFNASAPAVAAGAMLDHVHATPRDTLGAAVRGMPLPTFQLPSLPVRIEPGRGTVQLGFALRGDTIDARWGVRAAGVRWARDSGVAASPAGDLVWRAISGIADLDVTAGIRGTLAHPRLSVRSNLDEAIAARLRAVVGAEVAAAEKKLRAEVDRQVDAKAGPVRAQVTALQTEVTGRLSEQRGRLDQAQKDLETRLRELTRIRVP
ncbi:MAG TPA: TIGR03545 family protein [Gemmatimonadales bacterium]